MTTERAKHTTDYDKAMACLEDGLTRPMNSTLDRMGLVKFYELAYWQAWQVLKDELGQGGTPAFGPDDSVRLALKHGLIEDKEVWAQMVLAEDTFAECFNADEMEEAEQLIRTSFATALRQVGSVLH